MDITLSWIDNSDGVGEYKIYRSTSPFDMGALPEPLRVPIRKHLPKSKLIEEIGVNELDPSELVNTNNVPWLIAGDVVPVGIKHYYMISLSDGSNEVFGDTVTFGENTPLEPIVIKSYGYDPFIYRMVGGAGTIDYGDGTVEELVVGDIDPLEHSFEYSEDGWVVTIQLTEPCEVLEIGGDEVVAWGGGYYNIRFRSSGIEVPLEFSPYLTSMESMFEGWNGGERLVDWDVSKVTDMDRTFLNVNEHSLKLSKWDVSNVNWFNFTFCATNDVRSDITGWDTSNAVSMQGMFMDSHGFNQNLAPWSIENLFSMDGMFGGARSFNQDLSGWCVKQFNEEPPYFSVGTPDWFSPKPVWGTCPPRAEEPGAEEPLILHSQGDIDLTAPVGSILYSVDGGETWHENTEYDFTVSLPSEVETAVYIKSNDDVELTEPLQVSDSDTNTSNFRGVHQWWDSSRPIRVRVKNNEFYVPETAPPNITNMSYMFANVSVVSSDISRWDVSKVTNMSNMFSNVNSFNQDLSNWDVSNVTDMNSMLASAYAFNGDISNWDVSNVTDMNSMFESAYSFNGDISQWDVSSVTDMSSMFDNAYYFNSDMPNWDVSNVTNMGSMFDNARAFNSDISQWDVSNVTSMSSMFHYAYDFNSDISQWDVSNVTDMNNMFQDAYVFNGDISNWNTSKVTEMVSMFNNAYSFNRDISTWDVSSVTSMNSMFYGANAFNRDISQWNVSSVTDMSGMFRGASVFNRNLSGWCVSNITSKPTDFDSGASRWTVPKPVWGTCPPREEEPGTDEPAFGEHLILHSQGDIDLGTPAGAILYSIDGGGTWQENTEYNFTITLPSGVKSAVYLKSNDDDDVEFPLEVIFSTTNSSNFKGVRQWWESSRPIRFRVRDNPFYVPKAAPPNITDMGGMFSGASYFNGDISNWDVSNVTDMNSMFESAREFNGDISGWNVSKVTDMGNMFYYATAFNSDISQWDVSNVTSMSLMFYDASAFNGDLSQWDVSSVTDMNSMFNSASAFNQDLSSWCVSKILTKPSNFDVYAYAWALPKPVWGTCPPRA